MDNTILFEIDEVVANEDGSITLVLSLGGDDDGLPPAARNGDDGKEV